VALLAEAIGRAVDEDVQRFAQRELMDPLGIPAANWLWERDQAGHVQGFTGVHMRPNDWGRLGEVMRRKGMWKGRRLLAKRYVQEATAPSKTNGCYGFLHWVNGGAPCVGPTITSRPVEEGRDFPDLPADMYQYSGLFGQRVTNFPSLGLLFVRTGQDPGLVPAGSAEWEHETYVRLLSAVTDQTVEKPGPPPTGPAQQEADYGFQTAIRNPDDYGKGSVIFQDPLPPPGPERARAAIPLQDETRAGRTGNVTIVLLCPGNWPGRAAPRCKGSASVTGTAKPVVYDMAAGKAEKLRFTLTSKTFRKLRKARRLTAEVATSHAAAGGATPGLVRVVLRAPH
jgi:hypothetical protein